MNILDRLLRKEHPEATIKTFSSTTRFNESYEEKENRADKVNFQGIGQSKYSSGQPPAIYDSAIKAVKSFPVVYGCISAISDSISALGAKVYKVEGGQIVEQPGDHPFYPVFRRPNPHQGSFEFLENLSQNLDIYGNVFIAIEKVAGTLELYLLMPQYVAIIPDPKKKVKEYRYYINGNVVKYKPEEIIHIKYVDVEDPYYGMPPLSAASDVLKFETNRLSYASQFFNNGAIPAGVLETEQNLGDSLLKKLRAEWTNLHQGVKNSHKVAILQGGLSYKPIVSPLKDLDFASLKKMSKEDILYIYKVPESVLGNQDSTGASEGKDALTSFWRGSIVPRLKRIESALNRGLADSLLGNGEFIFEFNLKDVVALQEDKGDQAAYLERMVGASVMTPNEARAVLGLPIMQGDMYADSLLVSNSFFGNSLMPLEGALAGAGGAGSSTEKPSSKPKATQTPEK